MQRKNSKQIDSLYGNNIEAVKAIRVNVPLFNLVNGYNLNNRANAQYFFPEIPELNGKTITGIKLNAGMYVTTDIYGGTSVFDLPETGIGVTTPGIEEEIVGVNAFGVRVDKYLYLTLYNDQFEQILTNYPVHNLASYGETYDTELLGKIRPFNTKINIKNSYISTSIAIDSIATRPATACFTFFYK